MIRKFGIGLGMGMSILSLGMLTFLTKPEDIWFVWMTLGLILFSLSLDRTKLFYFLIKRNINRSTFRLFTVLSMMGLIISINIVSTKYSMVFDFTDNKTHTLQPQTKAILQNLQDPIHFVSFLEYQSPAEIHFSTVMERFQNQTKNITIEYVNPITNPERTEAFKDLLPQGSVFIQKEGKTTPLPFTDLSEQAIIKTIVTITSQTHHICFIYGHGELDIKDIYTSYDMGIVINMLKQQNYLSKQILIHNSPIPEQCEIAILAGPKQDLSPSELQYIDNHIQQGKNLFVLLSTKPTPNLTKHLANYGFVIDGAKIREQDTQFRTQRGYLLDPITYIHHPIMESISKYPIELSALQTIEIEKIDGIFSQHLATTSQKAEKKTDNTYETGPFPIISYAEVTKPLQEKGNVGGQIIVVGNDDLASNLFVANSHGNLYFFLNSISWLSEEPAQMQTRIPTKNNIQITEYQMLIIWLLGLLLTPGLILIGGIYSRSNRK